MAELDARIVNDLIKAALEEDLGAGDVTSSSVLPRATLAAAAYIARAPGVIAGLPVAALVYAKIDPAVRFEPLLSDGAAVDPGAKLAMLSGDTRSIFAGERLSLNFLQRLSGIATLTRHFVEEVKGLGVSILDTRKTTPGWRYLEKYAVRAGGGINHRMGLYDQVLIKDNHIAAIAASEGLSIEDATVEAIRRARGNAPRGIFIGVEAAGETAFRAALSEQPDMVLLDNMSPDEVRRCAGIAGKRRRRPLLEVSGGISLDNVREYAEAGVDRISVGALTHSAPALDIALKLEHLLA